MSDTNNFLDYAGLTRYTSHVKKLVSQMYDIKGSGIYADADYVAKAAAGTAGYEAAIDSIGFWQLVSGTWTKVTSVKPGWVFNIENTFATDANFIEGAGNKVSGGTNIVAINTGTEAVPVIKWDIFSLGVELSGFQTKALVSTINACTPKFTYATVADLPTSTTDEATAEVLDIAVITASDRLYRISEIAANGDITWVEIGDQKTVEGLLELLAKEAPLTPISDAEIDALFA